MEWHFRVKAPNEKVRDPIQGEFFSTEAIKNPADALVREAIQNSLDATLKVSAGQPKVVLHVRFFLATKEHEGARQELSDWFGGAWDHFHAVGNGLRDAPNQEEACNWLVIEDFFTFGLEGDISQSEPIGGVPNHFFHFFRAEGKSVEGGKERGRWGVGKYVFPRSSRANTFFGLTVRNDDQKRFLLGTSVFKSHWLGKEFYCPDGYFGEIDSSGLVLPLSDPNTLDSFCKKFRLKRTIESGLSVVIPWVDQEITKKLLVEAIVRGYFYPILKGLLSVTVETPESVQIIDCRSLDEEVRILDDPDLLNLVSLAQWASTCKPQDICTLEPCNDSRSVWTDDLIPVQQLIPLRKQLENGEKIAARVTLTVREKDSSPLPSFFDCFLWKDGVGTGRPTFIREGIVISDVRAPLARGIRSFVVIEAGPLGKLLGDAENPAHTEWQSKGDNFRGKYTYGNSILELVSGAVANFVRALTVPDGEANKTLLLDIFSIPPDKAVEAPHLLERGKKKNGMEPDDAPDEQEAKKKRFRVKKSEGGFTVTNGDAGTHPPARLDIKCAYDTRGKNPLNVYRKSLVAKSPDFLIGQDGVSVVTQEGVEVVEVQQNHLRIEILKQDFEITVSGFDQNRDLFVKVKMEEGSDDTTV